MTFSLTRNKKTARDPWPIPASFMPPIPYPRGWFGPCIARASTREPPMPRFLKSLFGQVVLALVAGVLLGVFVPDLAIKLKPLGDGFIKLIKMIIPVLVFCVVVHGIAGAGDLKRVGRVGVKALIYFEVLTTVALALGLVAAFVFQPGVGMNVDPRQLDASAMSAYASNADKLTSGGTVEFLMKLIPTTVVNAFA